MSCSDGHRKSSRFEINKSLAKDCDDNNCNNSRGSMRTILWNSRSTSSKDDSTISAASAENKSKTHDNKSFVETDKHGNSIIRGISQMSNIVKDDNGSIIEGGDRNGDGNRESGNKRHQHDSDALTHFCFLVHGYRGKPTNLSYLQSVMVRTALKAPSSGTYSRSTAGDDATNTDTDTAEYVTHHQLNNDNLDRNSPRLSKRWDKRGVDKTAEHDATGMNQQQQLLVIHKCKCNLNRTSDGVEQGGERLYDEVLDVIRSLVKDECQKKISGGNGGGGNKKSISTPTTCVTISMVGNSLGGLYSRYALAKISELAKVPCVNEDNDETNPLSKEQQSNSNGSILINGGEIRIHFNVFCTTATPHLGVSGHTWLPIPRKIECMVSKVMGDTGRDM